VTLARGDPGSGKIRLDDLELVIFDKDGTLIDFHAMWSGWAEDLARRLESVTGEPIRGPLFRALGFDAASGRTLAHAPLAVMPMARLRDLTVEVLRAACRSGTAAEDAVRRSWQAPDPVALAHPLADLPALFTSLREGRRRIAVATSDDRAPTEATLAGLGVAGLVDVVVCADDGLPVKPAPDMVLHLCRTLGIPPSRAAMIGDAPADLVMGRAAGVGLRVGVLSGVGSRRDLEPLADVILPSVASLLDG